MELLPAHLLKERFRFYLHYKQNEVPAEQIRIDPQQTFQENYKILFTAHVKLTRCLASRECVYTLYADADPGHAFAIRCVKNALTKTDDLLKQLCSSSLSQQAVTPPDDSAKENGKDETVKEDKIVPAIAALQVETVKECDELDRIASIADAKMVDIMARIHDTIRTDDKVTEAMRHVVLHNTAHVENLHSIYTALMVFIGRAVYGDDFGTKHRIIPRTSFLYHHDVTDAEIRSAIYKLQGMLVSKRELIQQLRHFHALRPEAVVAPITGDMKAFMRFGLQMFDRLFCAAGHYTTEVSIQTVTTLATIVVYIHNAMQACATSLDIIGRRRLVRAHGEQEVDDVEAALRVLYHMYTGVDGPLYMPWSFILNCPGAIKSVTEIASTILGQHEKWMFCI